MDVRYEAPETLQAAVALLAGATGPAKVLAGGTDVIVQMETDLIEPALLVDIKKIPETAPDRVRRTAASASAPRCRAWRSWATRRCARPGRACSTASS